VKIQLTTFVARNARRASFTQCKKKWLSHATLLALTQRVDLMADS
jgi:hypothetical protein